MDGQTHKLSYTDQEQKKRNYKEKHKIKMDKFITIYMPTVWSYLYKQNIIWLSEAWIFTFLPNKLSNRQREGLIIGYFEILSSFAIINPLIVNSLI